MTRILPLIPAAASFLLATPAYAQCPVCAAGAVAGVGFARWLGVDDTISGVWVGGMMVALTAWTINWFNKRNIRFKGRIILTTLVYYVLLLLLPLYLWTDFLTSPYTRLWGVNKLLLGIIIGSIFFFAANLWYLSIKRKNGGHAWFPFQKVAWPIAALIIPSVLFYVLTIAPAVPPASADGSPSSASSLSAVSSATLSSPSTR